MAKLLDASCIASTLAAQYGVHEACKVSFVFAVSWGSFQHKPETPFPVASKLVSDIPAPKLLCKLRCHIFYLNFLLYFF